MANATYNNAPTMSDETNVMLVGRYRIVRQLGQGGMGSVWLAEDTQLDNRQVAVKMLPAILVSNKRAYNQLKAEALVSLKLTHPNIATVRAFEENGGNPFLVVDYIEGQTLDDYLAEKGKLTEEETIRLLKPIADALDYAHGESVVHRDVKPANVMIRKDGHPFILDFGIAREIQETMTRVTGKNSSGTLMYMSPEQLDGSKPTAAQDVYSFAAMAYECLTGEPPFCRGAIEDQIRNKVPAALSSDVAIGNSVMAGLEKDAACRPLSCLAVLEKNSKKSSALKREEEPRAVVQDTGEDSWPVIFQILASCFGFPTSSYVKAIRRILIFASVTAVGPILVACLLGVLVNDIFGQWCMFLEICVGGLVFGGIPSFFVFVFVRPLHNCLEDCHMIRDERRRFNAALRTLLWVIGFVAGLLLCEVGWLVGHTVVLERHEIYGLFALGIAILVLIVAGVSVTIACRKYGVVLHRMGCS